MKQQLGLFLFLVCTILGGTKAKAQNPECFNNLSIYVEHVKANHYDAAYQPWKQVYETCPALNIANFVYGEKILTYKIQNAAAADKDPYIQDLLRLYDSSLQHFPSRFTKSGVATDKALLLYGQKKASDQVLYDMLNAAFTEDREHFTNAKALYLYFSVLVNLYQAGQKELQDVFDVYDAITEKVEEENQNLTDIITQLLPKDSLGTLTAKEKKQLRAATTNSKSYGDVANSIDSKLDALYDCDDLIALYQKNYEAKKGDINWVKGAVQRMFAKGCTDDPVFRSLFETQLALAPSSQAYLYAGTLKQKAGDYSGATADFDKAVALETNARKISSLLYQMATIVYKSSKVQARDYARKAIDANPANGRAYLLLASLYADSANACGDTAFEKRAVYWKAAELAQKAARVAPALSSTAAQAAVSYQAKAPSREMIFNSGMAGESITFDCWVGGTVTVPQL